MPRTLWPGLPDATAPGPSNSLGRGEESLSPPSWNRTNKADGTAALCIRVVSQYLGGPEMAHGLYRIHFVLCLLLAADFVDVR